LINECAAWFLADCTNDRAYATVVCRRLSSVRNVLWHRWISRNRNWGLVPGPPIGNSIQESNGHVTNDIT